MRGQVSESATVMRQTAGRQRFVLSYRHVTCRRTTTTRPAATIDLETGVVTKLTNVNPSDFHFATWRSDGVAIGFGYGINTSLWHFTARAQ